MQALGYYLAVPIIYLVSYSPFWVLYRVSDFFYFLMFHVIGYRKKVVLNNLKNAFPERSEKELLKIRKDYYEFMCDLFLETVKTLTWTMKDVKKRVSITNTQMLDELYAKNKSVVMVMGHVGNWEWAGPCFNSNTKHQLYVVYQQLLNPYFEALFVKGRTKFNTKIIPRQNVLRAFVANRKELTITAVVSDQAPTPVNTAHWMEFLNQDTPVFLGAEKLSKKFDQAVVYLDINRVKRGYYELNPTLMFENALETDDKEITEAFNKKLEGIIRERPEQWLWSHKRWKHKRPTK